MFVSIDGRYRRPELCSGEHKRRSGEGCSKRSFYSGSDQLYLGFLWSSQGRSDESPGHTGKHAKYHRLSRVDPSGPHYAGSTFLLLLWGIAASHPLDGWRQRRYRQPISLSQRRSVKHGSDEVHGLCRRAQHVPHFSHKMQFAGLVFSRFTLRHAGGRPNATPTGGCYPSSYCARSAFHHVWPDRSFCSVDIPGARTVDG